MTWKRPQDRCHRRQDDSEYY